MQPSIVEKLQLHVTPITAFRVYVGSGDFLLCTCRCSNVKLMLQGIEFEVDLFVLPVKGPDIVLGVHWLQGLGLVTQNFAHPTMEFTWKGKKIKLEGETSLRLGKFSFHQLHALVHQDEIHRLYGLLQLNKEEKRAIQ